MVSVIALLALLLEAAPVFAAGGDTIELRKVYTGNVRYLATGRSFRDTPNSIDDCSFYSPMERTVSVNLPVGATVLNAWLYVAASADINGDQTGPAVFDINTQTNLRLNGVLISTSPGLDERNFTDLTDLGGAGNLDFWGIRREVSGIVTGSGSYTLSGVIPHTEADGRSTTGTCLAAFALIVIYEDPSLSNIRVINLFDGFRNFQNDSFDLVPRNFVIGSGSPTGFMTHLTLEGDDGPSPLDQDEDFTLTIGAGSPTLQTNALNPAGEQYNSTVTGPDVFDRNTSYGLDLDTYAIDSQLQTQPGAFEAITGYESGQDLVILMAEVISVDNKDLADIEIFLDDVGQFNENSTNSASYEISVRNNGDGTGSASTGEATGYIHVYDDLPAGISIDSMVDITAPGWDCSATNVGLDQIRCRYDLSTLGDSELDLNEYLPTIQIVVDVATPTSPVTNRAWASLCGATDTCVNFNEKHTDADQFDPKNFFEDYQDLFDILTKSSTNNNVDAEVTPIIAGTPSDLSTSTKGVSFPGGTAEPGETLTYTVTLTETNGVAATGVAISDTIDSDLINATYITSTCAGASGGVTGGILTVTGMTVPASGSCTVTFEGDIRGTATPGTQITNTAEISSTNGADVDAIAPTVLVAGMATGSKPLYLDDVGTGNDLTRVPPASDSSTSVAPNNTITFSLDPNTVAAIDVNAGIIPASVWVEAATAGTYELTATLRHSGGTLVGSDTISGISMSTGSGNAQLFPFQINASAFTNTSGQDIILEIENDTTSAGNAIIHSKLSSVESSVVLDADTVINVDSIDFYDSSGTPLTGGPPVQIEAGQDIRIETTISDPFGAFDITSAMLTLTDPTFATQLNNVAMTEISTGSGTKTYRYTYSVPAATSVSPGTWTATITANEGSEGAVTHADADTFDVTAPEVEVEHTVDVLTTTAGNTLTYTTTIDNMGVSATSVDINVPVPNLTGSVNVTDAGGGVDTSGGGSIIITGIPVGASSQETIVFEVTVDGSAAWGDIINHTIDVNNGGTVVSDIAPSVLIDPFATQTANKQLYADNLGITRVLDRTIPVSDTTTTIPSMGSSKTMTLSPVLQSSLTLDDLASGSIPDITASVWVSRSVSATGERVIEATLAYSGASNGTIDTDTVTIELEAGSAQYVPFEFDLPNDLTLLANTAITLTITNDTAVSGESITIHSFEDSTHPTQISFTAIDPLSVVSINVYDDDIDTGGNLITTALPSTTVYVVATLSDPFGSADITDAELTVEDPNNAVTLSAATMTPPTTQPPSGAQRNFQLSHTLTTEEGEWEFFVTGFEGSEGLVDATGSTTFTVDSSVPDISTSYKTVVNQTSAENNAGDTLNYVIHVINSGDATLTSTTVTDTYSASVGTPTNVTVCIDAAPPSTCTSWTAGVDYTLVSTSPILEIDGFDVPAGQEVQISYDVTIGGGVSPGDIISNDVNISSGTISLDIQASDVIVFGPPATGSKALYLSTATVDSLSRDIPIGGDSVTLGEGGSQTVNMTAGFAADVTLTSTTTIPIDLVLQRQGAGAGRPRVITLVLGYGPNAGSITPISTQSITVNGMSATPYVQSFALPVSSTTAISAGDILQLVIDNDSSGPGNRSFNVYTDDSGNLSQIYLEMDPKVNIDSFTFHDDELVNGGGSVVTNPDPGDTIYARAVVSDPFGEDDIEGVDNEPTINITPPAGGGGSATVTFVSPEFNDGDPVTRTFEWEIVLPPEGTGGGQRPRGTWSIAITANEGTEESLAGPPSTFVFHTVAEGFTTLDEPNLSTSTKTFSVVGDVNPSDQLTYTITLNNTGGQDADNVSFSDTLQSSPVALTFYSASTTCTDEVSAPLPNPSHAGGVVTLSNISVTGGGSCTIDITVTVGAGNPGDTIDNQAAITNPMGPGASPTAVTILLQESQIPTAGSKQLYLEGIGAGSTLTRTQPTSTSTTNIAGGGTNSIVHTYPAPGTLLGSTLSAGPISVSLHLSETGAGANRNVELDLEVDPNDGGGFQSIDTVDQTVGLSGTPSLETFNMINSSPITLNAGSVFRLTITNGQGQTGRELIVSQTASAPYSEIVVPLIQPLEVTEITFWDLSGDDNGGCTPTCGVQIDPGIVATGGSIWARATVADVFGSDDINTGCDFIGSTTNCPTFTLTDPLAADQTPGGNSLSFLDDPTTTTRQFEIELFPNGFGLEGNWEVAVEASEGVEGLITDALSATFERYGPPVLTIVKSLAGTTSPGQILTYTNNTTNSGTGPATSLVLTNLIGDFQTLELFESSGTWYATSVLEIPFTINTETFSTDGVTFTYDPTSGICGPAIPASSPCYDPLIRAFQTELNEELPIGNDFDQEYRVLLDP